MTNVVAYVLGTKAFVDEARHALRSGVDLLAPAHWEAELTLYVELAARTDCLLVTFDKAVLKMPFRVFDHYRSGEERKAQGILRRRGKP